VKPNVISSEIQELITELSYFRSDDLLVNINPKNAILIESDDLMSTPLLEKVLIETRKIEKEFGINPLCKSRGTLQLTLNGKEVSTPLFLIPVKANSNKIEGLVRLQEIEESIIVNPFIIQYLAQNISNFDVSKMESETVALKYLQEIKIDTIDIDASFIGNFHHHRYALLAEIEGVLKKGDYSNLLQRLFFDVTQEEKTQLNFSDSLLFPSDASQEKVFEKLKKEDLVLQGPPGTGKSQVIANLIGKCLPQNMRLLLVSEKRAALLVIQQKLEQVGLGDLVTISTSNFTSKELIQGLKNSWQRIESETYSLIKVEENFKEKINIIQQELDLLNKKDVIDGLSIKEFLILSKGLDLEKIPYESDLPSLCSWIQNKKTIQEIPPRIIECVAPLKSNFDYKSQIHNFDKTLQQIISDLHQIKAVFKCSTLEDLLSLQEKSIINHRFSSALYQKYQPLLTKHKDKFLKLKVKYLSKEKTLLRKESLLTHWLILPSPLEVELLIEKHSKKGFLAGLAWKKEKKKWFRTPQIDFDSALKSILEFTKEKENFQNICEALINIGVENPDKDIEIISGLLHGVTSDNWEQFDQWSETEKLSLNSNFQIINRALQLLQSNFNFKKNQELLPYLSNFLEDMPLIISNSNQLAHLPQDILSSLKKEVNVSRIEQLIIKKAWVNFMGEHPKFSAHNPSEFLSNCLSLTHVLQTESSDLVQGVLQEQQAKFKYYQHLIETPNAKLKEEEITLKKILKKGKSILVKEFGKQRNHQSIRLLCAGEAAPWIQLLKPLWLTNPTQLASNLPLIPEQFDLAIVDEASQINLSHAVGTLYRSKRILIAGDSQQMAPSQFFKQRNDDAQSLLHKGSYYFKNIVLKNHYRSEHPALISFSNKHFYNNELVAFPSIRQEKQPLVLHYIENGIYTERQNENEAKDLVRFIQPLLKNEKEKLGIVAFSLSQLSCIFNQFSTREQELIQDRIDNDTLFFKSLENVQGDECDRLLISFGYGKNSEGQFDMRFGPINEKNGDKRLNVLFSRARKKIDFFTSVKSEDFNLQANSAVILLKKWHLMLEQDLEELPGNQNSFKINKNKISMENWAHCSIEAMDIFAITNTLKNRGWVLEIVE
jgi:DNA replication protein DnaC